MNWYKMLIMMHAGCRPVRLKSTWSRLNQVEQVQHVLANVESAVHDMDAV